jgi:hypothetical protein
MLKHILLLNLLISYGAYASADTNHNKSINHAPFTIPKQITNHPVKTTLGAIAVLYGLKLLHEANKTYAIKPDDDGAYNTIALATYTTGAILTLTGAAIVCRVLTKKIIHK